MSQSYSVEAILKATDKNFSKVFGDAEKNTQGFKGRVGNAMKTTGKVVAGATAAIAGVGVAAFAATKKVTEGFDAIAKNSRKMGVSTDYYQEMEYWASQNGLSHENMEKSMKRLNQRLGQAVDGNEKYSNALTRLGVNMDDVRNGTVTTESAMTQSIKALSEIENSQEKAALASELFGTKLSQELMPALDSGALSIEDAQKKAEELGIVIGEDSLNAAEAFNDAWDDITRSVTAVAQKVLAEFMPIFQSMMDWVLAHMPQIQAVFRAVFDVIGGIFTTAVGWIQNLISWLSNWFSNTESSLTSIRDSFKTYLTQVFENLKMVYENIKEAVSTAMQFIQDLIDRILDNIYKFWQKYGQQLMDSAKNIFESIKNTVETVFNAVWSIIQEVINLIVPFIQKQLKRVEEFWEENGEQIMSAVQNVMKFVEHGFNFIKGVIDFIMPVIIAIIKGAWDIISAVFETAIGVIMGLVKWFTGLLTGDFESAREGLTSIWESLWDGIKGIVEGAWNLLSGAFGALWNNISQWFVGLKDDAVQWGKNMIQGFIDGIASMGRAVANAASNVVSQAADFLKFWSPAKKGEGRFIVEWGENMIEGFLDSVDSKKRDATKAMNSIISAMQPNNLDSPQIDISSNSLIAHSDIAQRLEMGVGTTDRRGMSEVQQGITQHITINSPEPISASDNARRMKQAARQLAMEW